MPKLPTQQEQFKGNWRKATSIETARHSAEETLTIWTQVPGVPPAEAGPGFPSVHVPTCTWSSLLPALCTQFGRASRSAGVRLSTEPGVSGGSGKKVGQSPSFSVVHPILYLKFEEPQRKKKVSSSSFSLLSPRNHRKNSTDESRPSTHQISYNDRTSNWNSLDHQKEDCAPLTT